MIDLAVTIARLALGSFFVVSGGAKMLAGAASFERIVRAYGVRSIRLARVFSLLLPPVEVVVGIGLVLGVATDLLGVVAIFLLVLFSAALAIAMRNGYSGACGCAGRMSTPVSRRLIGRNLALAVLAIPIAVMDGGAFAAGSAEQLAGLSWVALVMVTAVVVPGSLLIGRRQT